jgi:AcrR family transcriptional regulator
MPKSPTPPRKPLREACIDEAVRVIEDAGLEALSLREVARRLGVSHQAPYKHFPSRDHILAEVLARCFDEFAAFLDQRPMGAPPSDDLKIMGERYMAYARQHPLKYRLMFNTPMPDPAAHPAMMRNAQRAFALLRDRLATMPLRPAAPVHRASASFDAMFVWSTLHGLASILQSDTLQSLQMSERDIQRAVVRCFARLSLALEPVGETLPAVGT